MQSIMMGFLAALCWGVHDLCVRYVSQRNGIVAAILTVMASGAILVLVAATLWGDWNFLDGNSLAYAAASGVFYALAGYAMYRAFAIGPVKLVAPLVASFPILSIAVAALTGQPVSWDQWLAVLAIVIGVGAVAVFSAEEDQAHTELAAILWGLLAALGFSAAFATGQIAASGGAELSAIACTRIVAVLAILALAVGLRQGIRPNLRSLPLLLVMGTLDAAALAAVMIAGGLPRPEFAAVVSSLFGLITVVLAWAILRERMTRPQWISVLVTFSGVAWLGL